MKQANDVTITWRKQHLIYAAELIVQTISENIKDNKLLWELWAQYPLSLFKTNKKIHYIVFWKMTVYFKEIQHGRKKNFKLILQRRNKHKWHSVLY